MQKKSPQKNLRPLGSPNMDPIFSGPRAKIKNLLPFFCSPHAPISEKDRHDPVGPKPREKIVLAKIAIFRPTAQLRGAAVKGFFG